MTTFQVPILSKMSLSLCTNPLYLMMTCAVGLSAIDSKAVKAFLKTLTFVSQVCVSYAFMLPVATGPNAICYGASSLKTTDMMRTGLLMNLICILTTW